MKKVITLLTGALLFIGCAKQKDSNVINIACNLPMTGYIGYYGEWIQNGMEMALIEHQTELDSLGITFKFDYQDNKGETTEAITILQKQLIAKPDIYMSGITSQTTAILAQIEKQNIPHMLWSWTPLEIEKGKNEFRCWVNYGVEGKHITNYCLSKNPQKVAYIYLDILGAEVQCRKVVLPALKSANSDINLYVEEYPIQTTDFKNIALKVKNFNPDVIVLSGFKEHIINMTKDFQNYNIDKSKVICSMDLLDAVNEVSNDILEAYHVAAPASNIPALQSAYTKEWINNFVAANGRQPLYTEVYSYDAMTMLIEAAKIAQAENISIEDALFKVDVQGVTGSLKFEQNGEICDNLHIACFKDGVLAIE